MSARIRKYVEDNSNLVNGWLITFVHKYLVKEMTNDRRVASGDSLPVPTRVKVCDVESARNKHNICKDILVTHFGIATSHIVYGSYDNYYELAPIRSELLEYMKDKASKPVLGTRNSSNLSVEDLYSPLSKISMWGIIYIYEHQEEYDFRFMVNKHTQSLWQMCVLEKELVDSAEYIAIKNAIDDRYANMTGDVCEEVFGYKVPHLNLRAHADAEYHLRALLNAMLPSRLKGLNSADIQSKIDVASDNIAKLTETLDELRRLQDSILEAEASGGIEDVYFSKLIEDFRTMAPLLINSDVKEEAKLAKMVLRHNN